MGIRQQLAVNQLVRENANLGTPAMNHPFEQADADAIEWMLGEYRAFVIDQSVGEPEFTDEDSAMMARLRSLAERIESLLSPSTPSGGDLQP